MAGRTFLLMVLGCWVVSVPVMFYSLDQYHTAHRKDFDNCPSDPCPQGGGYESRLVPGIPEWADPPEAPSSVWPSYNETDDRVLAQMSLNRQDGDDMKVILIYTGFTNDDIPPGRSKFLEDECLVSNCLITREPVDVTRADLVVTKLGTKMLYERYPERPEKQIVLWYQLESPMHAAASGIVNWTATYRRDSTINAPYYKFVPYKDGAGQKSETKRNYARGKTKKVAWFVSNCHATNGRLEYAKELAKYVDVDIYGKCGKKKCPRRDHEKCEELLSKDYKFYLAFENSHCKDYITEKFFRNGLSNDVLPIAFGAPPDDYARVAPPHSYIHTDEFSSPKHLAEYLHKLDADDNLYNEYFQWKGTGEFINTKFWCRVCAMLHEAHTSDVHVWYDLKKWWSGEGVCLTEKHMKEKTKWHSWRNITTKYQYLNNSYHMQLPGFDG